MVSGIDSTARTRRTVSSWWPRPSGVADDVEDDDLVGTLSS